MKLKQFLKAIVSTFVITTLFFACKASSGDNTEEEKTLLGVTISGVESISATGSTTLTATPTFSGSSDNSSVSYTWTILEGTDYVSISSNGNSAVLTGQNGTAEEQYITVQVTAKYNGSEKSEIFVVTVGKGKEPEIPATSIDISYYNSSLDIKEGDTLSLYATLTPSYTTDEVIWTSSDGTIATVNQDGTVTGIKEGVVTITATAGSVSDSVEITISPSGYAYKVNHYKEELNGDYTLTKTETLYTEGYTEAEAKDYVGFTAEEFEQVYIYYDEQDEINIYYVRNTYTISFDSNGGSEVAAVSGKYEESVSAPLEPTRTHYTFDGWSPELPSTFTEDLSLTAQWIEKDKGNVDITIY